LKKLNLLHLLPAYKENIIPISLTNSWLLGYIDSGRFLFYSRWHKSKKLKEGKELYLCCIIWHLNKDLLLQIKEKLNSNSNIEEKLKWNLPFYKITIYNNEEKNNINTYLLKYKLKSKKLKKYNYWKYLLNIENNYLMTGIQDLNDIEKYLKKLKSTMNEDELNKI
jgi:hypothetical protein